MRINPSMGTKFVSATVVLFLTFSLLFTGANAMAAATSLTAAQIVDKNVTARGGLAAWRAVQTMSESGKVDAGGKQNTQLPIVLELKRPRKQRIEIQFQGQTSVQVYDGTNGWKLRLFLNRHEVEPYTPDEMKAASLQSDLDGPLVDYAAKGTKIDLLGTEKVEGRDNYKLKLTLKNGQTLFDWIDTETFLETKMSGPQRRMDGKYRPTYTFLRDYRPVQGLTIPFVEETVVEGYKGAHKIVLDNVTVNPKLDEARFTKPK
jgi:hypothetical protein